MNSFWQRLSAQTRSDFFVVLIVFLSATAAFGLGRLSALTERGSGFEIVYPDGSELTGAAAGAGEGIQKNFVASASGSKYHLPSCPGASAIKDENKLYFATRDEAEAAGYSPAANCPGLQ